MDTRIVSITETSKGCFLANGKGITVENKGTFFKAVYMACKDVSAVAYTVDEAIMECYRKIRLHNANEKFKSVNTKHHSK